MRYMYTTKPDEHCHEVEKGIYGRPVHSYQESALQKQGWALNISNLRGTSDVRQKEEGREEKKEVSDDREAWADLYEQKFGKPPHHKMKPETIRKKLEESDD